ncbi:methyltransferase domain-containing protein [Candidatus Sulfidibacterium hydrothermale]|uniref:class I SAM-dependent methyltransferase n=1 Tax=Candidatus Sulfidibacterium hydrothermale TaxID=2875962 RepID=UPI001F0A7919|nr:class I SAM-dependent methyltransferase [Candidatus Sulfidibacterium hydrothermale]UBM63571.1 methyltransferase domain-containing protein [Candidatus Sulfidibacterium hydrothermale]
MTSVKQHIPPAAGHFAKEIYLWLRGLYYRGNRYTCPICGHHFRRMLPGGFDLPVIKEKQIIGAGRRENDICPRCQSTDRDRLIYSYLKYESDFFHRPNTVLHIAPEPALYKIFSKTKKLNYHPVTKYAEGFYYDTKVGTADLLDLYFESDLFDWVICNHVLEHIPDDRRAMQEIFRVLKPGGKAILQVPISPVLEKTFEDPDITSKADREKYYGQFDHVRLYGKDYPERLKETGFYVRQIHWTKDFRAADKLKKFALNPEEILYLCEKPDRKNRL